MYFPENLEALEQIKEECVRLVNQRAMWSGVTTALPLMGMNVPIDVMIFVELLTTINRKFGLSEEQILQLDLEQRKMLFWTIFSVGHDFIGKTISITAVKRALYHVSRKHRGNIKGKRCFWKKQVILGGASFLLMQLIGRNQVEQCYKIVLQYMSQIDIRHLDDVVDI